MEFIKTFEAELTCVKLRYLNKTHLKSNHYWIMAILPKLKHLHSLIIYNSGEIGYPSVSEDFYKFMKKAFAYF